jgi:hypothetical protein
VRNPIPIAAAAPAVRTKFRREMTLGGFMGVSHSRMFGSTPRADCPQSNMTLLVLWLACLKREPDLQRFSRDTRLGHRWDNRATIDSRPRSNRRHIGRNTRTNVTDCPSLF